MMKILFILPVILLVGCSSAPTGKTSPSDDEGKIALESEAPVSEKNAAVEVVPPAQTANVKSQMADAIRSGSDEAIYKTAISTLLQTPNDVKALNALGLYHYRKGRPLAARLFFSKAITLQSNSSELYSNLGLSYLATKDEPEAMRAFHKAIELNPSDSAASSNLGSIYLEHRDFNKAFNVLSLNAGHSKDIKFLNNFAIVSAWKGKLDQAEGLYQDALKLSPNNRELLFNYAIFQIEYQSKFKKGLETLDHLKLIGLVEGMKIISKELENKAKAGLK